MPGAGEKRKKPRKQTKEEIKDVSKMYRTRMKKRRTPLFLLSVLLLLHLPFFHADSDETRSSAAPSSRHLRLEREISLPGIGIRFRPLKDCEQRPLPALSHAAFRRSDGLELEGVSLRDAWMNDQCAASFSSPGVSILIGIPSLPAPSEESPPCFYEDYVTRESFDSWAREWKANARSTAKPGTTAKPGIRRLNTKTHADSNAEGGNAARKHSESEKEDSESGGSSGTETFPFQMEKWLKTFTGAESLTLSEENIRTSSPMTRILRYEIPGRENLGTFLFLCTDERVPGHGVVLFYRFAPSLSGEKAGRAALASVSSLKLQRPKAQSPGEEKKREGLKRTGEEIQYSEKYLRSRQDVISNIRNLPGWWYLETPNFILTADIRKSSEIEEIRREAEKIRDFYSQVLPPLREIDDVSVIRIFGSHEDYVAYVGEEWKWSIGIWMAMKKELVVSPVPRLKGKSRMEEMIHTLYHELFHQYLFYAAGGRNAHVWFNEGLAQLFEDVESRGSGKFRLSPGRDLLERGRRAAFSGLGDVRRLKEMSLEEFQAEHELSYPAVWSLVYFMLCGGPVLKEENSYAGIPGRYYRALVETGDPEKANQKAWEGIDLDRFQQDYRQFWNSKTLISRSRSRAEIRCLLPDSDSEGKKKERETGSGKTSSSTASLPEDSKRPLRKVNPRTTAAGLFPADREERKEERKNVSADDGKGVPS